MSSIEELKVVRLFRAYNTIIQICSLRGYTIRHPKAVAEAIRDSEVYDPEEGLDYDWFLKHFVVTPEQAKAVSSGHVGQSTGKKPPKNEEEENAAVEDGELFRRAAGGEWIAMRNALRLSCTATQSSASPASEEVNGDTKRGGTDVFVFFSGAPSLSVREVQDCREKALKKGATTMIIVANKIAPNVQRDVHELGGRLDMHTGKELLQIQVFEEESLAFNVCQHETVPPHVALSEGAAQAFLSARQLNISQLPRVLANDPVVQHLGLTRGRIVQIQRHGKESGPYDMYRQVI